MRGDVFIAIAVPVCAAWVAVVEFCRRKYEPCVEPGPFHIVFGFAFVALVVIAILVYGYAHSVASSLGWCEPFEWQAGARSGGPRVELRAEQD